MSAPAYTPPIDQPPAANVSPASPYGGFWVRLGAHFVDGIILWIISMVVVFVLLLAVGTSSGDAAGGAATLVIVLVGQIYHAWFVSSPMMATPGKRLCGLYVTDLEGRRLGFGHALGRNLFAFFSYITLYIGFIMIAFSDRKQALHDRMAGTLVHRQPGSSSGVVVAIVLVVFAVVAGIGILAAIAIPQYQDYTFRARVYGIYQPLQVNKTAIAVYEQEKGAWPATWEEVRSVGGVDPMGQLNAEAQRLVEDIRLERNGVMVASLKIQGKRGELRLAPEKVGDRVLWTCSASPEINQFAPLDCRKK